MSFSQTWIIQGKMLTPTPCTWEHMRTDLAPPRSLAFFCPHCGEVWARRIISPETRWNVLTHECPKHPAPRYCEPAGSIWINANEDFVKNLPLEVLKYETLLRLELDK